MPYDMMVVAAHPDDAETQMGGTLVKLASKGQRVLLVDLSDGEPTEFAERGVRAGQAAEAARILGVDRMSLGLQDWLIQDTPQARLSVAMLIQEHQPRIVFGTGESCIHPDHAAAASIVKAAVFLARLDKLGEVPGGERLVGQTAWKVERLFFPHCKMEPAWSEFAFAVDVSEVYDQKRRALAAYESIFDVAGGDQLLNLYEAEDQYFGRLVGVRYAEIFRSHSPLVVEDPTVFAPGIHA